MAMTCPNCVYYNTSDTTCRRRAPDEILTSQSGNILVWPPVKTNDWCSEGYNTTDGFYDMAPKPWSRRGSMGG